MKKKKQLSLRQQRNETKRKTILCNFTKTKEREREIETHIDTHIVMAMELGIGGEGRGGKQRGYCTLHRDSKCNRSVLANATVATK